MRGNNRLEFKGLNSSIIHLQTLDCENDRLKNVHD